MKWKEGTFMSLTVAGQASYYYNMYLFSNSNADSGMQDESEISKEYYGVSDVTDTLAALKNVDSVSFGSISNLNQTVGSMVQANQIQDYDTYRQAVENSSDSKLLSGNTDLSALCGITSVSSEAGIEASESSLSKLISQYGQSTGYGSYLSNVSSGALDLLA
jgi:hypothetical protein